MCQSILRNRHLAPVGGEGMLSDDVVHVASPEGKDSILICRSRRLSFRRVSGIRRQFLPRRVFPRAG